MARQAPTKESPDKNKKKKTAQSSKKNKSGIEKAQKG